MKKYFKKIFILLITFFGFVIVAKAGNVSISASNYTVTVGSTIKTSSISVLVILNLPIKPPN